MKKPEIDSAELLEFKDHWQLYASTTVREKRLRFLINYEGNYKVTFGDETLYEGAFLAEAKKAWDNA